MIVERKQRRGRRERAQPDEALRGAVLKYLAQALPKTAFFCLSPPEGGPVFHGLAMRELAARPGFPTLLVLHDSRAFCIALKADGEGLQTSERDCHAALQDARVPVTVARSVEDVRRFLSAECALPMRNSRSGA